MADPALVGVTLGAGATVHPLSNVYGCIVGAQTRIAAFAEVQQGAVIGARCKVSSHSLICDGVVIEDEVFVGHHVCFTNDRHPRATNDDGQLQTEADWECLPTLVRRRASIGSGAVILPGITIGEGALVGAGAVVTQDVPPGATVVGNPARVVSEQVRRT